MQAHADDITALLKSWRQGDQAALSRLAPMIRRELRLIAKRHLVREGKDHIVQPSSLVQEAFVRLLPGADTEWRDRVHFFAVASQIMRHILVDHARERGRQKRGGDPVHVPIDAAVVLSPEQVDQIVAIDLALQRLERRDQRKSKVFEMRFFAGLSVEETAEALGIAPNTVVRDWNFARAWLRRDLGGEGSSGYEPLGTD
jgi:RNA polymerase sigma factor (TIGR02999 family)